MPEHVGRFAPSPTGDMHLGIARTSLAAWLDARRAGGQILLRIEDIDTRRTVAGSADGLKRDLEWLGLDWDGEVLLQTQQFAAYAAAVDRLRALGRIYRCTCSRKEIALASSAPHASDAKVLYPGTCRTGVSHEDGREASLRLRTVAGDHIEYTDRLFGPAEEDVSARAGDFVLYRRDGMWAYQLAVVVDDLAQGVTSIVRGADLLDSTPRQLLLRRLLAPGAPPLSTLHIPLLLSPNGRRLAKRDGAKSVAELRDSGVSSERIVGALATSLGLTAGAEGAAPGDLIEQWDVSKLPKDPAVWSEDFQR